MATDPSYFSDTSNPYGGPGTNNARDTRRVAQPIDPTEALYRAAGASYHSTALPPTSGKPAIDAGAQQALNKNLWANAGVSAGLAALQIGAQVIPTAQDERNKRRLAELERLEAEGKLGLSGAQRGQMERDLLNPVRALATEGRQRAEAQLASAGNSASAADLNRIQRQADDQAQQMAYQAGSAISQENLAEARRKLKELEQRTAYKSGQQTGRREAVAQNVASLAPVAGEMLAYRAPQQMDFSHIEDPATREHIMGLWMEAAADPNALSRNRRISALSEMAGSLAPSRAPSSSSLSGAIKGKE